MKCTRFFLSMPFAFGLVHSGSESPLKGEAHGLFQEGLRCGRKEVWVGEGTQSLQLGQNRLH